MGKLVLYRLSMVFLFLAAAGVSLVGCGPKDDSYVVVLLNPTGPKASKLADQPTRIDVPPAQAGRQVAMGDLVLTVPEGWRAENPPTMVEDYHGELGYGRVFSLAMTAGKDVGSLGAKLSYREERSWLSNPNVGFLGAMRHATPEPVQFLSQFSTDLELQDSANNTFLSDVSNKFGKKRERSLALLVLKSLQFHPTTRYAAPNCVTYGFQTLQDSDVLVYGLDVFDKMGLRRGMVCIQFPATVSGEVAEKTVRQVLGGITFTNRSETPPAKVGESKR